MKTRTRFALIVTAMLLSLGGCDGCTEKKQEASTKKQEATTSKTSDPQWVAPRQPEAKVAVVFVHGLFGDTLGTWTHPQGQTFFSLIRGQPDMGTKIDVFAFGFESNKLKSGSLSVNEASNWMHQILTYNKVLDYPAVVFVAHSMGGLVTLRYLLSHRELIEKVPLVVLYASPQEGAQIAVIADKVARNPALRDMFPADTNTFLQQLNDDWRGLKTRPPVVCAYEKVETDGVMIVPWSSATRYCDEAAAPIGGADHITIVKPDRATHGSVIVLANALERYVTGKQLLAKLEMPDFKPEGEKLAYELTHPAGTGTARLVNAGGGRLTFTLAQIDPFLHVWPETPKEIAPRKTENLAIKLGWGASKAEYEFNVASDVTPDRKVIVRVPNMTAYRAEEAKLVAGAMKDVARRLEGDDRRAELVALPAGDPRASEAIVKVVRRVIAERNPDLPGYAQLVLAAEFLAAANWPELSVSALRAAERESPGVTKQPATLRLAGVVAAQSGIEGVFLNASTPKLALKDVPASDLVHRIALQKEDDAPRMLATQLQKIPALKSYGFVLEGDVHAARGDYLEAKKSYTNASATKPPSPLMRERLEDMGKARTADAPAPAPYATMNTDAISKAVRDFNVKAAKRDLKYDPKKDAYKELAGKGIAGQK